MRNSDLDRRLRRQAEQQHRVVSRAQFRYLGGDRWAWRRRLASGEWEVPVPQVLRLSGSVHTFRQRSMVGVLQHGDGTVVSGISAARLWQLPGFDSGQIVLSRHRMRSTRHQPGQPALRQPCSLPPHHCTTVEGIPVTTVARTLFLAGSLHPGRTERALDNAMTRHLLTLEAMRETTIELREHGRTGAALMRRLLRERGAGSVPPASGLEARFLAVLKQAGIDAPAGQVDLGGASWVGRVDHVFRQWRIVVEIDSELHHSPKLDRESDARRDAALGAAGFDVLRFTDEQVWERPGDVVASVRAAIERAKRRQTARGGAVGTPTGTLVRSGGMNVAVTATFVRPEG